MDSSALGMIEYETVSSGMMAADLMAKTSDIRFIEANVICPGKYIILFSGELAAVKAAIEVACQKYAERIMDCFVIGNPHKSLLPALAGESGENERGALGIMEFATATAAVLAADTCAKAAVVRLTEVQLSRGMCGKSFVLVTGSVANVEEAIDVTRRGLKEENPLLDYAVISHPDEKFWKTLKKEKGSFIL